MRVWLTRVLLPLLCFVSPALAAPEPTISFQSMLDMWFSDDNGMIRIEDVDLIFAPEGELKAAVALVDSENIVVESHEFYPDPRWREGVFARLNPVGPAQFTVTEPGVYNIVFLVDGKPISRLPVALEQTDEGDDPFDPVEKFRFYGLWQVYGYLTMNTWKEEEFPQLNLWLGGRDLAEDETKDMFKAELKHDGEVLAHSQRTQGFFNEGHYEACKIMLYHPHEDRASHLAKPFLLSDWTKEDGEYSIDITRKSDGALIRSFKCTVADGKIQPLESSALDFDPHIDYSAPRVIKKGSNQYEFVEAIWLKSE